MNVTAGQYSAAKIGVVNTAWSHIGKTECMNIIVGVILGQLLFYLSMYAGDLAFIVANEIFAVHSSYVIYLSIRKAHIGKFWKRVHSWLFPAFATSVVEILFLGLLRLLTEYEIIGTWVWFVWMAFVTRAITIPLSLYISYLTLRRFQSDSGDLKWTV